MLTDSVGRPRGCAPPVIHATSAAQTRAALASDALAAVALGLVGE